MSFPIVASGITVVAGLLGWTVIKEGIRAGVKMYSGPFSAIPKLIMWGFDGYKKVAGLPQRLVVLLSKRVGGKLLVRSAYVIVSGAAKGAGWGIVKIAKGASFIGSCLLSSFTKGTAASQFASDKERYNRVILDMGESTTPYVYGCGLRDVTVVENFYEAERPGWQEASALEWGDSDLDAEVFTESERLLIVSMDDDRDEQEQIREFEDVIGGHSWNIYTMTPEEAQAQASSNTSGLSHFMEEHNSFISTYDDDDDDDDDIYHHQIK